MKTNKEVLDYLNPSSYMWCDFFLVIPILFFLFVSYTIIFLDLTLIDILKENKDLISNILENDEMGEPVQSEKDVQVINDLEREIESTDVKVIIPDLVKFTKYASTALSKLNWTLLIRFSLFI